MVTIGKSAFTWGFGWLGSTIAHEAEVHAGQQLSMGFRFWPGQQWRAVQEVQAYRYELANASRFGLSGSQISVLQSALNREYNKLNALNRYYVDQND